MLSRQEINKIRRYAYNRFPNRSTINILKLLTYIKHLQRQNRALTNDVATLLRSGHGDGICG